MGSLESVKRAAFVSIAACWLFSGCSDDKADAVDAGNVLDGGVEIDAAVVPRFVCQSQPGTRLSREYIEPSTGAREEGRLIDKTYGTECRFLSDGGDSYSCYPVSVGGTLYFTDANCTVPLIRFGQGATPSDFFRSATPPAETCGPTVYSHRKVQTLQVLPAQVYRNLVAGCTLVEPAVPGGDYYDASAALDAAQFVSATTQPGETTGRLSNYTYAGEDGSTTCRFGTIRDHTLATNCFPALSTDATTRCLPSGQKVAAFFSDVDCTIAVEAAPRNSCVAVEPYAYSEDTDVCGNRTYGYKTVGPNDFGARYQVLGQACASVVEEGTILDEVVNDVPPSDFAAIETVVEGGPGRLHRVLSGEGADFGGFSRVWHDDKTDSNCSFQVASDGVTRCLPGGMKLATYYTDVDCLTGINLAILDQCQYASRHIVRGGGKGLRIFATTPHIGTVYEAGNAACTVLPGDFLEQAHELAASSFVGAEVLQE